MAEERLAIVTDLTHQDPVEEVTGLEQVREYIRKTVTRRGFMGTVGLGAVAFYAVGCSSTSKNQAAARQVYVANALGMVVGDPTRCVGCRRCESACVAFNEGGKVQPSISKVKVGRNLLFGQNGVQAGTDPVRGEGIYGNFRVVQENCRQCPHPVPCQLACPHGAIEVVPPVNARVVNVSKCQGCGICTKACPWGMPSLDGPVNGASTKMHKCTLCNGHPECVEACPAGALTYQAWTDRTDLVPPRQDTTVPLAPDVKDTCNSCH